MSTKVLSAATIGLDCQLIEVEADTSQSLPGIFIVGLPDKAVDESRERVRSAIKNAGLEMPRTKVTINLAPADLKKQGPSYDLPIAMSILMLTGAVSLAEDKQIFIGELALDGTLRPVTGVLSVCLLAQARGITTIYVPAANAGEARLIPGLNIIPCLTLRAVVDHIIGVEKIESAPEMPPSIDALPISTFDMAAIKGQQQVKRALEIAAAGGHNILLSGPPGSGKTLLAKTLPTILPSMTMAESLEVTRIYSVCGLLPHDQPLMTTRPFRSPHHTASGVALVGGGAWPRPGEISLAHRGVLFLDEFPEFPRPALENLRQPLEDGVVSVARASGTLQFPAKFILLAAMNPCPCGYSTDPSHTCTCLPLQISNYQKKISGPLLDRIDLHVEVPKVHIDKLTEEESGEPSEIIRERVEMARQRQLERFTGLPIVTNAEMSSRQTRTFCPIDSVTMDLLRGAVMRLNLSARSYFRILKIARTIADLASAEGINQQHVAEALQYRPHIE